MNIEERVIVEFKTSQILNTLKYAIVVVLFTLTTFVSFYFDMYWMLIFSSISLLAGLYFYYDVKLMNFILTNERVKIEQGVFITKKDNIEIFRIKDYGITQPIWLKPFDLYNLHLITTDRGKREYDFKCVKDGENIIEKLRRVVKDNGDSRGEMDLV